MPPFLMSAVSKNYIAYLITYFTCKTNYENILHSVTCLINGQPTTYGQTVDVQSPSGKADVIIVFEQSAFNAHIFKELITPLIPTLSNDLKQKGLGYIITAFSI